MMEEMDINAEYERIFGVEHRVSLYDGDDQYTKFRQEIIDAPFSKYERTKLPFEKIQNLSYYVPEKPLFIPLEYKREEIRVIGGLSSGQLQCESVEEGILKILRMLQAPMANLITTIKTYSNTLFRF